MCAVVQCEGMPVEMGTMRVTDDSDDDTLKQVYADADAGMWMRTDA